MFSTAASKRGGHRFGSDTRPFCVSQCVFSHLCTSASSHTPKTYKNYIRPKTAERPPSNLQLNEQIYELMCTELWKKKHTTHLEQTSTEFSLCWVYIHFKYRSQWEVPYVLLTEFLWFLVSFPISCTLIYLVYLHVSLICPSVERKAPKCWVPFSPPNICFCSCTTQNGERKQPEIDCLAQILFKTAKSTQVQYCFL